MLRGVDCHGSAGNERNVRVGEVNQSLPFFFFRFRSLAAVTKVNEKLVARNPQDLCQESKIENESPQLLAGRERRDGDQERK